MRYPFSVEVDVFCTEQSQGSPQSLTFLETKEEMQFFKLHCMKTEMDYSIVYYEPPDKVYVRWYNHAGVIQFCGSAAFGLSYYVMTRYSLKFLRIYAPDITLSAYYDRVLQLRIPCKSVETIQWNFMHDGTLYRHSQSGIYMIEVRERSHLHNDFWTSHNIMNLPLENPHGLCLFYWAHDECIGYVRYFTPWHGRDEDHVTGSIQQYLTPLVHRLYGISKQKWVQCSDRGGTMRTQCHSNEVIVQGECCPTFTLPDAFL